MVGKYVVGCGTAEWTGLGCLLANNADGCKIADRDYILAGMGGQTYVAVLKWYFHGKETEG